MFKKFVFGFKVLICAVLVFQMIGCGTILYPNRSGQRGGRIDPGVVVMDGLCVLLFVIPGVIAFIVDFSDGAIYYPRGRGMLDTKNANKFSFDTDKCKNMPDLEKIIKNATGYDVSKPDVKIYSFSSMKEFNAGYAALMQTTDMAVASK